MKRAPLAVAMLGIVAGGIGQLVSSLGLSGTPARVLLTVGALAAVADQVREKVILPRRDETARLKALLMLSPVPRVHTLSPYDVGVFRSSIARELFPDADPPYVHRHVDETLDAALRQGEFVLVTGPSKSGKSRTAFEALRRTLSSAFLIVPVRASEAGDTRALDELAAARPRRFADQPVVVWLDDVEAHLRGGQLTPAVLRRLRGSFPKIRVVATLRYQQLEELETDTEVARDVREILTTATRIDLPRDLNENELVTARETYPGLGRATALGEYLTATDLLVERYRRGREVHPEGAAVVRATVDWERTGVGRPIPREDLYVLANARLTELRANLAFTGQSFDEAVAWACEPVVSTAALLTVVDEGYSAFDYVVDWVSANEDPVDDATWARVIGEFGEAQGLSVGLAAYSAGRPHDAARALAAAASQGPLAALQLGVLREEQGDADGAAAAYELAIDSGHPDAAPAAAFNLGLLRQQQGDAEKAATAYQLAIDSGHPQPGPMAAVNLGLLREQQGDADGAAAAFQLAIDSGHPDQGPKAAVNLGLLRVRQTDADGAAAAFQLAIDSGHPDAAPAAARNLGVLLYEHGDTEAAVAAFLRLVIEFWHPDESPMAAINLGLLREQQGDAEGAAAAFQLAIDSGHPEAAPAAAINLGALLYEHGDTEAATAAYKLAINSGHLDLAPLAIMRLRELPKENDG